MTINLEVDAWPRVYTKVVQRPIRVDNSHPVSVWDTARILGVSKKRTEEIIRELERRIHRDAKTGEVVSSSRESSLENVRPAMAPEPAKKLRPAKAARVDKKHVFVIHGAKALFVCLGLTRA